MPRKFTFEQVGAHNNSHPNNKYAVIHGDVYRIASIPFGKCPIEPATVEAALVNGLDVSGLFGSGHTDGSTVRLLKSTQGCQVGTIVQAPAGTQQGQPAHGAQPAQPGNQGQNVQQPDADDDEGGTAAERRRREEARNRRLRKTYNPLREDPDDADEYPADAVAMGYLPDFEGRRWREKRMRLSRAIQFNDLPAIDEEDVTPAAAAALDLDFAKEIRYQRNLKGGEARGCTGSFRAARPPPPRSQLRPRDGGHTPGGPPPADPPDSDAGDDDGDDDAPGAPAAGARQVQVEGRVRQWFPSNSNRAGLGPTHLATPPVTPLNPLPQQTARPPVQPPPPPPQQTQQLTPQEEEEIAKQRRADEAAAAEKAIRKKQKDPAVIEKARESFWSLKSKHRAKRVKPEEKPQEPKEKQTRKQEEDARKKRQEEKTKQKALREREDRRRKKEAADEAKRQKEQQAAQREEDEKKKRILEYSQERVNELGPEAVQDGARRAEETQKQQDAKKLESMRDDALRKTKKLAEEGNRDARESEARDQQKGRDSQAAIKAQFKKAEASRAAYGEQQKRINDLRAAGYTLEQARDFVRDQYGELVEDPSKKAQDNKGTTTTPKGPKGPKKPTTTTTPKTPPKRPADTTEGGQGSSKKIRTDDSQKSKKNQTSSGGKYGDSNRPFKKGEEPWNKGKAPQNKKGLLISRSDDEDSPDELGPSVATTGGPTQPPQRDLPDLPSDVAPAPTTTRPADTTPRAPSVIPPPGGIPTTTTTGGNRPGRRQGVVGFRPGSEGAVKFKEKYGKSTKR